MKNTRSPLLCALAGSMFFAASVPSIAQTLVPGVLAPNLQVGKWVKGAPVAAFEPGHVYVVEFWATWCVPCKQSIPLLSKLAEQLGNQVTVIGVSVWEQDTANVKPYVKQMGDKMDYRVANDDQASPTAATGFMSKAWLDAASQDGIPTAFVVGKDGKLDYIGSPSVMVFGKVVEKVLNGSWDRAKAAETFIHDTKKALALKAYTKKRNAKDWAGALKATDDLAAVGNSEAALARQLKYGVYIRANDEANIKLHFGAISSDLSSVLDADFNAVTPENQEFVLKSLAHLRTLLEEQSNAAKLQRLRIDIKTGNAADFESYARTLVESDNGNADVLDGVAWRIVAPDQDGFGKIFAYAEMMKEDDRFRSPQLIALANKAINRAMNLTEHKNGSYLDTLAWVQFRSGDMTGAAKTEREASMRRDDPFQKKFYETVADWFAKR
ncbi:MAG TPA: TlpA disulfide reductase family protein [Fimbriimonadaceae bacterium]|jgi:thiol-disulfide isomerase/thioredoxin